VLTADGNNLLVAVYVGWKVNDPTIFPDAVQRRRREGPGQPRGIDSQRLQRRVGKHPFGHFISTDPQELKFVDIEHEMQTRIQADCRALTNGIDIAFLGIKRLGLPRASPSWCSNACNRSGK
jgi:hypothetical protein